MLRGKDIVISSETDVNYGEFLNGFLESGKWPVVLGIKTFMYGCCAGVSSALGIGLSPFIRNKYVVFSAPFFIIKLFSMITEYTYLTLLNPFHIPLRQGVQMLPFSGIPYEFCYILMLMLGIYMLFAYGIRRKRRRG